MAVTNPSSRESVPADEQEAGVGMRHVTVVPTNFEATEDDAALESTTSSDHTTDAAADGQDD
ncbi:hydrolase [Natrialba hulunbeirensis JCM 10989]|uniref:Hydrolase n=1 Tax=Natrialba hulunbeirensis JCM 10989 TaxID=1227493 RepID=M0A927_9EURY|nr:hypothetical protein [Natrialba hulunbeirensis]ELY95004.1 hydrolase [Natrialba hulunbeirensis JCM 10989]